MNDILKKGALVRVVKLCKDKKQLGSMWVDDDKLLARKLGALGLIVGIHPLADNVYFVGHREEGNRTIAVYGADEIELVKGDEAKLAFLLKLKRK